MLMYSLNFASEHLVSWAVGRVIVDKPHPAGTEPRAYSDKSTSEEAGMGFFFFCRLLKFTGSSRQFDV